MTLALKMYLTRNLMHQICMEENYFEVASTFTQYTDRKPKRIYMVQFRFSIYCINK